MAHHADELVWTLHKGTDQHAAEVRTRAAGCELRLSRNGELYLGRRHEARAHALAEAEMVRRGLERDGWKP